jgi:hypothetical protein
LGSDQGPELHGLLIVAPQRARDCLAWSQPAQAMTGELVPLACLKWKRGARQLLDEYSILMTSEHWLHLKSLSQLIRGARLCCYLSNASTSIWRVRYVSLLTRNFFSARRSKGKISFLQTPSLYRKTLTSELREDRVRNRRGFLNEPVLRLDFRLGGRQEVGRKREVLSM